MNGRSRSLALSVVALGVLAGCGKLVGLGGEVPPLAQIDVEVTGDLDSVRQADTEDETPHLRVALVWAAQSLPEPFCVLPPESADAAAVIAAGCPDSFGFVPARVGANVEIEPGAPSTISLVSLPSAEVMIGDVTARIAYASLVVYDDRDGTGALELHESHGWDHGGEGGPGGGGPGGGGPGGGGEDGSPAPDADVIYGASLISMTEPDQRVAFREGVFNRAAAFYPREGCPDPPRGFSILSAGGFSVEEAIAAVLRGELPREDPANCEETPVDEATITIPLEAPEPLRQLGCLPREDGASPRYRDTAQDAPDLTDRAWACVGLPTFGEPVADDVVQLVAAGLPTDACKSITHWVLRGCERDPSCETPEFDQTATPPEWWPCGSTP